MTVTNAPGGNGSALLIDDSHYQTIRVSADITLTSGAHNGGLLFGYKDRQNFWVYLANRSAARYEVYQIVTGAWTLKAYGGTVAAGGGTFSLTIDVRSGGVSYNGKIAAVDATVHPGQVGAWAGAGSAAVKVDNFKVRSLNADLAVDGRFYDDIGPASVTGSQYVMSSSGDTRQSVLQHVRIGGAYLIQADVTARKDVDAGLIVNYQDPENFGMIVLRLVDGQFGAVDAAVCYLELKDGKVIATRASGSTFSGTDNTAYTLKAVVTESGGAQTLNAYVGGTLRLTTTTIDDPGAPGVAGYVGLWRAKTDVKNPVTHDQIFDNVKCGQDQNADGDVDDAGDHLFVSYDFGTGWNTLTLTYDDNGNLTAEGLRKYRYDAWNRLVKACYSSGDLTDSGQLVGDYEYDGGVSNSTGSRRLQRIVANRGSGVWNADADGTYRYFYSAEWQMLEVKDGSNLSRQQWVYGTQYVDELVLMDNNVDLLDNDCDPDVGTVPEQSGVADARFFYHQDRNWNVIALTAITDGSQYVNGDVVERYTVADAGLTILGSSGTIQQHSAHGAIPDQTRNGMRDWVFFILTASEYSVPATTQSLIGLCGYSTCLTRCEDGFDGCINRSVAHCFDVCTGHPTLFRCLMQCRDAYGATMS